MNLGDRSIERRSLVAQVADELQSAILDGQLKFGESLNETELAGSFGVSRATVREALRALGAAGLLEKQRRKAWQVKEITGSTIWDVAVSRAGLEGVAACLLSRKLTREQRSHLAEIIDDMAGAASDNDAHRFFRADLRFHRTVMQMADNQILFECWLPLHAYSVLALNALVDGGRRLDSVLGWHRRVFDAISSGDSALAEGTIKKEIYAAYRQFAPESGKPGDSPPPG